MTEQQIEQARKMRAAGKDFTTIGATFGVNRRTVARALSAPETVKSGGRTMAEFRREYDKDTIIPAKIEAALDALGDSWEPEVEFLRRAGVNPTDMSRYREQFADYYIVTRGDRKRIWWGSAKLAAQARELVS